MIGTSLVNILCHFQAKVTVATLDNFRPNKKAKYIKGNLTDFNFCKKITKNKDFAFHLAGIKGSVKTTIEKPASFFVPLLMMNTNFLEACRLNKISRLVYTSSIGAYSSNKIFKEKKDKINEPPMDMHPGWAKRMAELQIQSYKKQYGIKNYYIVRPCNVYGPGDNFDPKNAMFIPTLINKVLKNKKNVVLWGDGTNVRDFAYCDDVALGIIQTLKYGTGKLNFLNLGSGKGYTIKQVVKTLKSIINFDYKFDSSKPSGFKIRVMDIKNAKVVIKYKPQTDLKVGLKRTLDWYKANYKKSNLRFNYFK